MALHNLHTAIIPLSEHERVDLHAALGRILAVDISSPINLPPERNAAMDGYAFCSTDLLQGRPHSLTQIGTAWAGKPFLSPLKSGECVRIFTGAVLPDGTDSVVMQEQVQVTGQLIQFPVGTAFKQNVREAGEDIRAGETLLPAGKKLIATDLGLLASAGLADVAVIRALNVAFFSTGDELAAVGQPLASGQVYDSNRTTLHALLKDACYRGTDLGVIADDPHRLENTLISCAQHYDVMISTGGASVGDADYIQQVLAHCGEVKFWKIAIKPGKPLAFGKIGACYFFGLPGNPVAVVTTFQKVVTPALQQLCGAQPLPTWRFKATCLNNLNKKAGRLEFLRGILNQTDSGDFEVRSAGAQGSNILSTFSKANCYMVLSAECQGINAGEQVTVELF
jgi:molybdopterin molybdotransferase